MYGLRKIRNFLRRLFRKKGGVWVRIDEDSPWVRLSNGASVTYYPNGKNTAPLPEGSSVHIIFEYAETVHKRYWTRRNDDTL